MQAPGNTGPNNTGPSPANLGSNPAPRLSELSPADRKKAEKAAKIEKALAEKRAKEEAKKPFLYMSDEKFAAYLDKDFAVIAPPKDLKDKDIVPLVNPQAEVQKLREAVEPVAAGPNDRYVPPTRAKPRTFREDHLNKFIEAITQVVGTTSDVIFNHDIGPKLVDPNGPVQVHMKDLPQYIKKAAHHFIDLGFAVNQNVEKAIKAQDLRLPFSDQLNIALDWLVSDKAKSGEAGPFNEPHQELLYSSLLKETLRPDLQKYHQPILQWLLKNRRTKPLVEFLGVAEIKNPDLALAKEALLAISKLLVESKIDYLGIRLTTVLKDQLPSIVKSHLREDVMKVVTRIELEKVAELIRELDWTKFIDTTVGTVRDLMGASKESIQAEMGFHIKNKETLQKAGVNHEIVRLGSNEAAETTLLMTYGGYRNDKKESVMHEVTAAVLDARHRNNNQNTARIEAERKYYDKKVDQIFGIFFPSTTDELHFWKDQFGVPAELHKLYEEAKTLATEIISPELVAIFKQMPKAWLDQTQEFIELMVLDRVKALAKEQIIEVMTQKLNKYTHPDKIDALMANDVLPKVIPILIDALAKLALKVSYLHPQKDEKKKIVELFNTYIRATDVEVKKASKNEIKDNLYRWTQRLQKENNITALGIGPQEFASSVDILFNDLEEKMNNQFDPKQPDNFSVQNVVNVLDVYFAGESKVYDAEPFFEEILRKNYPAYVENFHQAVLSGKKEALEGLQIAFRKDLLNEKTFEKSDLKEEYKAARVGFNENADKLTSSINLFINKNLRKLHEFSQKTNTKEGFKKEAVKYYYESKFTSEAEADKTLDVYVSLINNIVDMSTLSGPIKTLMGFGAVKRKIREELGKNIKFLRASPEFALNQIAEQVPKAVTEPILEGLIYYQDAKPKEELRFEMTQLEVQLRGKEADILRLTANLREGSLTPAAKKDLQENLKAADIARKEVADKIAAHELGVQKVLLQNNFVKLAGLIQNLAFSSLDYENQYAASFWARRGSGFARGIVGSVMGKPTDLANMISDMYKKMFHYQWKTKNNAFQLLDVALNTFEAQNKKIIENKKEAAARV